ncbi:MAG: glycosyltransferase N-terminal domain-containing protein, partial [Gemmatimonadota bacterium]
GYLPWDLPGEMGAVLDAASPDVLVFTKTEVWPTLVAAAAARNVPCALVGGTVPPGAGRARWPARALLRSTWARLELVGAISGADAEGFRTLGVRSSALEVTGDPGIDSAAQRARGADPEAAYLRPFIADRRPTVVAGSTWPADDAVLLPALLAARTGVPEMRVILAPHEPDAGHVAALVHELETSGWSAATLGDVEGRGSAEGVDVVVVDRVGVLAHLYTVGDVAYVGGGFHDAGLHSVLEPAAARLPVCFGPRHRNARAAGELLAEEGAQVADDADSLGRILTRWLSDGATHNYAARRAFGYIERHLGAAERSAALLGAFFA